MQFLFFGIGTVIVLKKQLGIPSYAVLPPLGVQRNEGEEGEGAWQEEEEEKEREEDGMKKGRKRSCSALNVWEAVSFTNP